MVGYFVSSSNHPRFYAYFKQIAYIVCELSLFGSAFAENFATLVVTRFLGGGGSSVRTQVYTHCAMQPKKVTMIDAYRSCCVE
jgi:hypothetical protein